MIKNKFIAILITIINLIIVIILIAFVINNDLINILLAMYVIFFSSIVSFLSRKRDY
ncbi:MAG: hypothetical protein ACOCV1_04195 [Bacillota bacterium]